MKDVYKTEKDRSNHSDQNISNKTKKIENLFNKIFGSHQDDNQKKEEKNIFKDYKIRKSLEIGDSEDDYIDVTCKETETDDCNVYFDNQVGKAEIPKTDDDDDNNNIPPPEL